MNDVMVLSDKLCSYNKTSLPLLSFEAGAEGDAHATITQPLCYPLIQQHRADTLFFNDAGYLKITTEMIMFAHLTKYRPF